MANKIISYRLLGLRDLDSVISLLNKHYTPNEILAKCIGLKDYSKYFKRVEGMIKQGHTFGAFYKNKLVGCAVNAQVKEDEINKYMGVVCEKEAKIHRAVHSVLQDEKKEDVIGTQNFWEYKLGCIHENFRELGIFKRIHEMSLQRAKKFGCKKLAAFAVMDKNTSFLPDSNVVRKVNLANFVDPVTGKKEFKSLTPPRSWAKLAIYDV